MVSEIDLMLDHLTSGLSYKELAQKYRISEDSLRGRVSANYKTPATMAKVMELLKDRTVNNDELEAKNIVDRAHARFKKHYKKSGSVFWISDVHIPYQNTQALALAYELAEHYQPDYITVLNDFFDFKNYSKWETIPDPHYYRWVSNIDNQLLILETHVKTLRRLCPNAQFIALAGNHDKYVYSFLRATQNGFAEKNVTYFMKKLEALDIMQFDSSPKRENVVKLGRLKLVHGISAAKNDAAVAKSTIEALGEDGYYYYTASGHVHRDFEFKHNGVVHYNFGHLSTQTSYMKHYPSHWNLGVGMLWYDEERVEARRLRFIDKGGKLLCQL